jgi:2-oxoisovalerate dehydrogenase E1 component
MCGFGAEIAQSLNELAFDELDAPVGRLHSAPTSHPFAPVLERAMLVDAPRIAAGVRSVIAGIAPRPDHWHAPGLAPAAPEPAAPASATAPTPAAALPDLAADEVPVTMPFGDLTISEGRIVAWMKSVGEAVAAGETIAEIETDKAVVEIEAPDSGTLARILEPVGATVPMGARIGAIAR